MEFLLAPDQESTDGLSAIALVSLCIAFGSLVDVVVGGLEGSPLTEERLRLLLAGGPGAHAVGCVLVNQIVEALVGAD